MSKRSPMENLMGTVTGPKRQNRPTPEPPGEQTESVEHAPQEVEHAAPGTAQPAHPTPVAGPPAVRQERPASGKPRARAGRPRNAVDSADPTRIFNSTLSLPVELTSRLKDWAHEQRVTYAEVVMAAVEAHYDELSELVTALQPAEVTGRLFTVTEKTEPPPRQPVTFHMENRNLAVLDQLVDQVGATNRSELCTAALDAYLPPAE